MTMPMAFVAKHAFIYAKAETTNGTYVSDATLFTAANIVCQAGTVTGGLKPQETKRDPDGGADPIASVFGQLPFSMKWQNRLFTSGTAGTVPSWDPLAKACYLTPTIVASTSVTYARDMNQGTTLSVGVEWLSEDGTIAYRQAMSGVRGNLGIKGKWGEPLMMDWDFTGAWQNPSTTTPNSSITFTDETVNGIKLLQIQGTPTGLFTYEIDGFEFDVGAKVEMMTDTVASNGLAYAIWKEFQASLKLGYRLIPKATADELNKFAVGTQFANSMQLGSAAGKIFTFTTNAFAQYAGLEIKPIGAAQGLQATVNLKRDPTQVVLSPFTLALT